MSHATTLVEVVVHYRSLAGQVEDPGESSE
jgi:hypothetical protein